MDSPITSFSLTHSSEPPALSLPLLDAVAAILRPPSTCVTFEMTMKKGGQASVKTNSVF